MIKVEGWNGIRLEGILDEIQKRMGYKTRKETLTKFIDACSYNVVTAEIISQLKYIEAVQKGVEPDEILCDV